MSEKSKTSLWIIEPHEPLIFRDGRPFSLKPGAQAHSLPFPFPSTTTGGVRTQAGLNEQGIFAARPEDMLKLKVRGPLLVQLPIDGYKKGQVEWLAPAPTDALLLKTQSTSEYPALLKRLQPIMVRDALTDLNVAGQPEGIEQTLLLVGMQEPIAGKPVAKPPAYWNWDKFQKWLLTPEERTITSEYDLGIMGPQQEQRVHVAMDGETRTGKDTALFETRGMEFVSFDKEKRLQNARPLALAVIVDEHAEDKTLIPREGFAPFGGERRIVNWRRSVSEQPSCPPELIKKIGEQRACRVILLTPAYFRKGFYPTELQKERDGVTPIVQAIAVQRPEVISGWDFVSRGPKETRRLAPAGTVLFLKLKGTTEKIEQWVQTMWLQCISDIEQDRNDGFGLAVVGTWNEEPQEMVIGEQL